MEKVTGACRKLTYELTDSYSVSSPAIDANGNVYVGSSDGVVTALDANGGFLWSYDVGGSVDDITIGVNSTLYVISYQKVTAIDARGRMLWIYNSPSYVSPVVLDNGNNLYVVAKSGAGTKPLFLEALSTDGLLRWTYPVGTSSSIVSATIGADGTIYVVNDKVYAIKTNGTLKWSQPISDARSRNSPLIASDGTIYVISAEPRLYILADNSGGLADSPWARAQHDGRGSGNQCYRNEVYYLPDTDGDGDGMGDCFELIWGFDPQNTADGSEDNDSDGLINQEELELLTDPFNPDTDADGLTDRDEVLLHGTDPLAKDSDHDGIDDAAEIDAGFDPSSNTQDSFLDSDNDGFSNRQESLVGTDLFDQFSVPEEGSLAWTYQTFDGVYGAPAIDTEGIIYVTSISDSLYALFPNGERKWTYPIEANRSVPVIGADGTIYVQGGYSWDNHLLALHADGTPKWSYETGGNQYTPAIGSDGIVYAVGTKKEDGIHAIDKNGEHQWFYKIYNVQTSPIVAEDGTLYFGTNNALVALNPDGTLKWTYDSTDVGQPIVDLDGTVYFSSYDSAARVSRLNAINPDNTLKWSYESGDIFHSTPYSSPAIGADGTIYISGGNYYFYAIKPDGEEKWHVNTGGSIMTPAIGADGTIYVGGDDSVYAFNSDMTEKWVYRGAGIVKSATIAPDGTVYIGNIDGKVFAFVDNAGGAANSPWPMFGRDARHSGNVNGLAEGEPFAELAIDDLIPDAFLYQKPMISDSSLVDNVNQGTIELRN